MSVTQSLSTVTACIPRLKPFYESLESGMIRSDDMRRRDGEMLNSSRYYMLEKPLRPNVKGSSHTS
jgi:hypothetical protein